MRVSQRMLILLLLFFSCAQVVAGTPVRVFVSILPQQYFFEQIGAEHVEVSVMVGPGQSPATFDPTPRHMVRLAGADVYQRIGVPFERAWMQDITARLPELKIVDAREGIKLRSMEHQHESGHSAGDTGKDPHIWTDPLLVIKIADQILDLLIELAPQQETVFKKNHRQFVQRLEVLDKKIRQLLYGMERSSFMVFHPSWGYFAERYGLHQIPVEQEGKSPGARALARFVETAQEKGIKTIFVQKQFSQRSAAVLAALFNGSVVAVDPLAYDYPENMERVANAIAGAAE